MKHLDNSKVVFAEIFRVLKPGGVLLFEAPNRSHYMPLIARCTPHRFNQLDNKRRRRTSEDTLATHYLATMTGFNPQKIGLFEGRPEYLRVTFITYMFEIAYERIINVSNSLSRWSILLLAELHKSKK